jgi:uncharacterized protein YbaR (Trm112 family)
MNAQLLAQLRCPETHQKLALADETLLAKINEQIEAGAVQNRSGARVSQKLEAALVREDGKVVYPIRNGLPIMLVMEAIAI